MLPGPGPLRKTGGDSCDNMCAHAAGGNSRSGKASMGMEEHSKVAETLQALAEQSRSLGDGSVDDSGLFSDPMFARCCLRAPELLPLQQVTDKRPKLPGWRSRWAAGAWRAAPWQGWRTHLCTNSYQRTSSSSPCSRLAPNIQPGWPPTGRPPP